MVAPRGAALLKTTLISGTDLADNTYYIMFYWLMMGLMALMLAAGCINVVVN